ncbi:DUF805 domain-containing protein [Roseibium sp. SCP14]|uniref:DUF805 domain-containing protein n=1 Tax=Roseibium sp. SCP14 TaxID=3141375 RepID=UPI00333D64BE
MTKHFRGIASKITPLRLYWICLTDKYSDIQGRAGRKEFWSFMIGQMIFGSFLYSFTLFVDPFIRSLGIVSKELPVPILWLFLGMLFSIGTIYPWGAVAIRRMHDWGQSGKLLFVSLSPLAIFVLGIFLEAKSFAVVMTIVVLPPIAIVVICAGLLSVKSSEGSNKYGPPVHYS